MFTFGLLECHKCFLFSNISWLDSLDYIYILLYMYICFMCVYLAWVKQDKLWNFGGLLYNILEERYGPKWLSVWNIRLSEGQFRA